jgi:two-component system, OmpR family, response regulator
VKVLVIEDEPQLSETLTTGLRAEGCDVTTVGNGLDGLWEATENVYDAIILDIDLPRLSAHEMLRRVREAEVWTPVLTLSASDGDCEQADVFDLGADAYLTKPFSFIVLVARLRALVRRGGPQRPVVLTAGTLSLDPARRVVRRAAETIALTPREYGLLHYLMRNKGAVMSKIDILHNVWDPQFSGDDNLVEVYVFYVRRKIDFPFGTNTIQTVRGVGYRLDVRGGAPAR